jgi:hypothetical protein
MLDLVTHDEARPALSTVRLEGPSTHAYGQLAELIGKYQPEFVPAPGFHRKNIETLLLLVTPGLTGSPKTAGRR